MKKMITLLALFLPLVIIQGCAPVLVVGTVAGAGASVATDRRAADKIIEDESIEIQATDYIYSNKEFGKKVHINVTSFNGIVLLTGESPSEDYVKQIVQHVGLLHSVTKVIDNIQITMPNSFEDRTNDFWITSKVKSHLIADRGLLTRTKVITSNGIVYLMGLVTNKEANDILKIVNEVEGIKKVVPLFEPLDGSLDPSLEVSTHIAPSTKTPAERKKADEVKMKKEDEITVKPYVLQPPIKLNDENK